MKNKLVKKGIVFVLILIVASCNVSSKELDDENSIIVPSDDCNNLLRQIKGNNGISRGWTEEQKLTASDGESWSYFGCSVSIDGDYSVIGTPWDDDNGGGSGSAYVFKYDGISWDEEQKLTASDGEEQDYFGWSVCIDGDNILIGAVCDEYGGSAYVFKYDGVSWNEEQKLTISGSEITDDFGCSVSIDGDIALIGARAEDNFKGSAYVFKYDGTSWNEEQKLLAYDGEELDWFGYSVCIDGDNILIGAAKDNELYNDSGAAYVFKYDGMSWNEEQKLIASDGERIDNFGCSVSIDGDNAIIGSYGDNDNGENSGSAYVFKYDDGSWIEEQKLLASDGHEYDRFGFSVSIDGDYVLIGADGDYEGSAYVFKYDGISWTGEQKLTASDAQGYADFGRSVCIDGDNIFIGAPRYYGRMGAVYLFVFEDLTIPDLYCTGRINWNDVTPGETVFDSIWVQNIGGPGTMLNWEILDYPDWGTWTFSPDSGTGLTPEDGLFEVEVSIVAPDKKNKEFTGEIIIVNSDDPSDTCNIDVSLTTPRNRAIQTPFQQFLENHPNMFPLLRQLLGGLYNE